MRTIFKYSLDLYATDLTFQAPANAKPLDVQLQFGEVVLWMVVERNNAPVKYSYSIFGTGHEIPADYPGKFVASLQAGPLVWHVYVEEQPNN